MKKRIEETQAEAEAEVESDATTRNIQEIEAGAPLEIADADSASALEGLRVRWLGRKGELTSILRGISDLEPD